MATSTAVISPISEINMLTNCNFYQCRMPNPPTSPWSFNKRDHKRHPSFSLFENALLTEEQFRTSSLPSTPHSFSSLERNFKGRCSYWGEERDFQENISSLLPSSSTSSGYCSGSLTSEAVHFAFDSTDSQQSDQNTTSIPHEKSLPFEKYDGGKLNSKKTNLENSQARGFSGVLSSTPQERGFSGMLSSTPQERDFSGVLSSTPQERGSSGVLSSTQTQTNPIKNISETTDWSSKTRNGLQCTTSSKLSSVYVHSKRSSSESSTSSAGSSEFALLDETTRRRIKDDEGFIRRAACVCVNEDESKVVLISSKNEGGGWLIPGGGLESGEGESEAAVREAWEEAGITGCVKRCLGVFQCVDEATQKKKRTAVYVLQVCQQHSVFPEARLGRVREWFAIDRAMDQLSKCKPHQIAYLKAL